MNPLLDEASAAANAKRFPEFLDMCRKIRESQRDDLVTLLDTAALLSSHGFLSQTQECLEQAKTLSAHDFRAQVNLANLASDRGNHPECRRLYGELLARLPDSTIIRRNVFTSQEYDPEVTSAERLEQGHAWNAWAIQQAGGWRPRPTPKPLHDRPLRIGYVSADFCQHTAGLFCKDVLMQHDPQRVKVFAYSAKQVNDWVTDAIKSHSQFRAVTEVQDPALVELIRQDEIDILIDLSGHTSGSRLTAFAYRPAPVMLTWLGYFATTGLEYLDAVLLDEWHAPAGTESQFIEPIIRLPSRLCYTPVPFAPAVSLAGRPSGRKRPEEAAPTFTKGYITFGSFNNTAKYNPGVFDLWARILTAVPDSRLILKWRTFNDEEFRQSVTKAFVERGIAAERIELRGPGLHIDVLKEYADIDIALDPFPFTGGLTSCEALYMGVPVVTWPQSRVVSRQTYAFLSAIGLPELAAKDCDDYVRIAVELAQDRERLNELRTTLRPRMAASPLCDVKGFTRQLEDTLIDLYHKIEAQEKAKAMNPKTILHVGPGHRNSGAKLPPAFLTAGWKELRLDIDPQNEPDILGSMLDMAAVASNSVDAIYSSHNVEHVYAHEVPQVLKEFLRVLKPDGFLVVTCPDLQTVATLVAEDKLGDAAYQSVAGPITPLDILYGHTTSLAAGNHYMAHKCGFTLKTLTQALHTAGFASSAGKRRVRGLDLWLVATKNQMEESALRELAGSVMPA